MSINSQGGQKNNLELVSAFIASSRLEAEEVLETRYKDDIEKLLSDAPRPTSENPLKVLSPKFWPPIFHERHRLIINDVPVKTGKSKIDFIGNEYTEYLTATTAGRNSYERVKSKSTEDEDIANKVNSLKKNQSLRFRRFISATDQTLANLWNNKISQRPSCLTVENWSNTDPISAPEFRYLLARCGISLLPGFLKISETKPTVVCRILLPVAAPDVAPLMASQLIGSSASRVAKKWLLRHSEVAIHGLLASAVGKTGKERNSCETALRFIASRGLQSDIAELCKQYGPEVEASVNEILSVDTSYDYHQKALPKIPEGAAELDLNNLRISEKGESLPKAYVAGLLGMMSLSSYDSVYPSLEKILSCFDSDSLSIFSWNVFQSWDAMEGYQDKDKKKKKEAEWMYHSLSYMGNDVTVKKLIPFINSWPKEGGMNKSVIGLDILSNIGSDYAIRSINSILLKTKYKPLLARSEEIMEKIAEVRGLTKAELDDRLVPTFGLNDSESFKLDFGPRSFTIEINEKLAPLLLDQDNKKVKTLPKAAKGDDKAKVKIATAFWNELKADIKTEASTQLFRFEKAMLNGRQWTAIDFKSLLAAHPFLGSLVRSLVWAEVKDGKIDQSFRLNSDGIYLGADDNEIVLTNKAIICIPHPIHINTALDDWQNVLAKNQLKQPFAQITRKVYLRKDDTAKDLFGIQGAKAPAKAFRGLKAKGWVPEIGDGGAIWSYEKSLPDGKARLGFEGIVTMYDVGIDEDQKLEVTISGKPSNIEYSEVIREISDLLH